MMAEVNSRGTLLIQRLDAVLGTLIASRPHLVAGRGGHPVDATPMAIAQQPLSSKTRTPMARRSVDPTKSDIVGKPARRESDRAPSSSDIATPGRQTSTVRAPHALTALQAAGAPFAERTLNPRLSALANMIVAILESPELESTCLQCVRPLTSTAPARATSRLDAHAFSDSLRLALKTSGLFYESHLARYSLGEDRSSILDMAPQSAWRATPASSNLRHQSLMPDGALPSSTSTVFLNGSQPITAEMAVMLRQQLDALAMQRIQWAGIPWPGATMSWLLHRGSGGRQTEEGPNESTDWTSHIVLDLPTMGKLDIRLSLAGCELSVRIVSHCVSILTLRLPELEAALTAKGLAPSLALEAYQDDC